MARTITAAARRLLVAGSALGGSLACGCVGLGEAALCVRVRIAVAQPPEVTAAICATGVRRAFPAADHRPYARGALAFALGKQHFAVVLAEGADRQVRAAGDVRLAITSTSEVPLPQLLQPSAVECREGDRTDLPVAARGSIEVRIVPATDGCRVDITQRGSMASAPLADQLVATLGAASAVETCRRALVAHEPERARECAMMTIARAEADGALVDPHWLARVHAAAAQAQQALQVPGEAARSLEATLDLAPEMHGARTALAILTRDLAQPVAARAHDRTLAALPGLGFTSLAGAQRAAAVHPLFVGGRAAWLAYAAERMAVGDLACARRHAQAARGTDAKRPGPALALLAAIAERAGDPRLAGELRLSQAQVAGFTPEIVLALSQALARQGDAQRATLWLCSTWRELGAHPSARALLHDLLAQLGPERASRVLAASGVQIPVLFDPMAPAALFARVERALRAPGGATTEPAAMPGR